LTSSARASMLCSKLTTLPKGVLFLRLENFSTTKPVQHVATPASAVVEWAGKIWLLTLGPKGGRSPGATLVAEIGRVLDVPSAASYVLDVNEADFGPEMKAQVAQQVHTHPGPEIFYLLTVRRMSRQEAVHATRRGP
jgi:hypothetical protein